ncbi:MAG TPA: OsmC family protein [Planctomycetota bacterium]|nr:OsmC family protein [Planctomycetota bacterium]
MSVRHADAVWEGNLREGRGTLKTQSGALDAAYSFSTRFEEKPGTNPEELIAAAHAGCFSMALASELTKAGFPPQRLETTARVHLEKGVDGFRITKIALETRATVPGIEERSFQEIANGAKEGCPVSRALRATPIELHAALAR